MQLSWFPLMPAWGIRKTSDSLQRLERPKEEEAGWHRRGLADSGWWPAGWRWAGYHCPLLSGLFCLFEWPERLYRRLMSWRVLKDPRRWYRQSREWSSGLASTQIPWSLWESPIKGEHLSPCLGKMVAEVTHAAAFIWGSVLLSVCLLSFSFYLTERETVTNPGSNRTDKVCPGERPLLSLNQALNSSKATARVARAQSESSGQRQTPQQTPCASVQLTQPRGGLQFLSIHKLGRIPYFVCFTG